MQFGGEERTRLEDPACVPILAPHFPSQLLSLNLIQRRSESAAEMPQELARSLLRHPSLIGKLADSYSSRELLNTRSVLQLTPVVSVRGSGRGTGG